MARAPDILERFGVRLRELRTSRGYSQEKFGEICGLDRTYISGIERGKRNVSLRNLEVIANALDLSISDIFEGMKR